MMTILGMGTMLAGSPRSIGFRAGNNWDISYQHYLNEASFLTIEAGTPGYTFSKTGATLLLGGHAALIYDMLDPYGAKFKPIEKGEWHWYMGVGLKGGVYAPDGYANPYWHAGVATHIGVEYDFVFPMIIFIDSRATFGVTSMTGNPDKKVGFDGVAPLDLAIGLRYKFN